MNINPQMLYCPKCKGEYLPRVATCALCMVPLVAGSDLLGGSLERKAARDGRGIGEGEDVVPVHKAPLRDLKPFEALLAAENIASIMSGDENSCGKGCCPSNFYLMVRRSDAADAVRVIEAELVRTSRLDHEHEVLDTVFDPNAGEAVCPACGTTFSTRKNTCPDCGLCFG